jgi:thymidylate synthase (FAD)
MKIIKASVEWLNPMCGNEVLKPIEIAARTCYKSKVDETKRETFIGNLIKNGHEAMIEHGPDISMKFICDRGVSHEIVRHRIASFAQESTRYCNYGKDDEITIIEPCFWKSGVSLTDVIKYDEWEAQCYSAEKTYLNLLRYGASPQEARSVLPNSLKTEIIVKMNLREWRHFFKLRTAKPAHPQMREVAILAYDTLTAHIPVIFDDITPYRGF